MDLKDFYKDLPTSIIFKDIKSNSKDIKEGDIFVAIKGASYDGYNFIGEAISRKCAFVITERFYPYKNIYIVENTFLELRKLLKFFYNLDKMKIIGVTGTDGKTTTSLILYHILNFNNQALYIGTNGLKSSKKCEKTTTTTESIDYIYRTLYRLKEKGVNKAILEISSEGILNRRIDGIDFIGSIFTNLSHEHLNSHKTMHNYFNVKKTLFKNLKEDTISIINEDDKRGRKIKPKGKRIGYGIERGLYKALNIKLSDEYSVFDLYYKNIFICNFRVSLFGQYNIYNALAAIVFAYELGTPLSIIKERLETLPKIDGRFMEYKLNNKSFIVDFAHTPNGLYNILSNVRKIKQKRIILVMGCAGEKDISKRHLMSKIACDLSDIVIFTSEDPKNESIISILSDMTRKLKMENYYLCLDRKEAIKLACSISSIDDVVIITGKGNETKENIKGITFRHNDLEEIKKATNL